jgi:hypothetical protein
MNRKPANENDRPMAMTAEEAANYVGCRSTQQFRREIKAGIWPRPIAPNSRPQRWSIFQLDAALTGSSNSPQTDPHLAAFEKRMGMR